MKNENYNYLHDHSTQVLKTPIIDLLNAYKNFFESGKGFPKFKSKHNDKQSCLFSLNAISKLNTYENYKLTLTKQLKNLKFACSERDKNYLVKNKSGIKSMVLTKTKTNKYFLSILIDGPINSNVIKQTKNDIIGIDFGIKTFVVGSEGTIYENLKLQKEYEYKLKILNRRLSKKQKGSKNKDKARLRVAKVHEKIHNIKLNYLHNISNQLVSDNQTIVIEYLNVNGMMKNHKLAKSIQDLSLFEERRQLIYKSNWYGRDLIVIDQWFPSSKKCNDCGYIYKTLSLNEREWICPKCGKKHDRDKNAAKNIEDEGKRILNKATSA
jgi:putative transposase